MTHQEVPIFESPFTRTPANADLDNRMHAGVTAEDDKVAKLREQRAQIEAQNAEDRIRTFRRRVGLTALSLVVGASSFIGMKYAMGTPLENRNVPTHSVMLPQGEGLNDVIIDEQKRDNLAPDQIGDLRDAASRLRGLNEAHGNTPETSGTVIVPDDIEELYQRR